MYEIVNNSIDYKCVVCGMEIPQMAVLDESKSVVDAFHGQHLQILISGRVDHQCDFSAQTPNKDTTGRLESPLTTTDFVDGGTGTPMV